MAWTALIPLAMSAVSAIAGNKKQKQADKANERALKFKEQQYAERSPFRQYALRGLGQMGNPIQSAALFQNKANPFSRGRDFSQDFGAQFRQPMVAPSAPQGPMVGGGMGGGMGGAVGGLSPDQLAQLQRLTPLGGTGAFV